MSFRSASDIKTISDAMSPDSDTILDGDVGATIDVAMSAAAGKSGIEKTEKVTVDLPAVINGKESPVEIIQTEGNLMLDDVIRKIRSSGFRVEARPKKSYSSSSDRVTLTIAWNTV